MNKITSTDVVDIIYRALKIYEGPEIDNITFEVDGERNSPEIIISIWDDDEVKDFAIRQKDIEERI